MEHKAGEQVLVQFCTRTSDPWYAVNVPCVILVVQQPNKVKGWFEHRYLVQRTHDNEIIGLALVPHHSVAGLIRGQLLCEKVEVFGTKSQWLGAHQTFEQAKRKLGFK